MIIGLALTEHTSHNKFSQCTVTVRSAVQLDETVYFTSLTITILQLMTIAPSQVIDLIPWVRCASGNVFTTKVKFMKVLGKKTKGANKIALQ